jgi:hypothetical protein
VVDLPTSELLKKYPEELLNLVFAPNGTELAPLLERVGQNVEGFFLNLPNSLSKERIRHESLKADGKVSDHVEQDVEYMLFLQKGEAGNKWKEERTNSRGKPATLKHLPGESFVSSGFALECILFLPSYQKTLRLRYLGRQSSEPYAHLIAFAQDPGKGGIAGVFQAPGVSVTIWRQGLVWVDPQTFQIIRMKSDLLEPKPEAGLMRETTDIWYREFQFGPNRPSLWLPREVVVSFKYGSHAYRNIHRYSDYRLFTVESYEKHEPVKRPQTPE